LDAIKLLLIEQNWAFLFFTIIAEI
jgi:hypothetical protein